MDLDELRKTLARNVQQKILDRTTIDEKVSGAIRNARSQSRPSRPTPVRRTRIPTRKPAYKPQSLRQPVWNALNRGAEKAFQIGDSKLMRDLGNQQFSIGPQGIGPGEMKLPLRLGQVGNFAQETAREVIPRMTHKMAQTVTSSPQVVKYDRAKEPINALIFGDKPMHNITDPNKAETKWMIQKGVNPEAARYLATMGFVGLTASDAVTGGGKSAGGKRLISTIAKLDDVTGAAKTLSKLDDEAKAAFKAMQANPNNPVNTIEDLWKVTHGEEIGKKATTIVDDIGKNFDEAVDISPTKRRVNDLLANLTKRNKEKGEMTTAVDDIPMKTAVDDMPSRRQELITRFFGPPEQRQSGFINFGAKVSLRGDELQDATEGLYQIFKKAETPDEAVQAIRELSQEAAQNGDTALFQALKKAAQQYKSDLVTGRGLPRDPANEAVIKQLDEVLKTTRKEIAGNKTKVKVTGQGVSSGDIIPQNAQAPAQSPPNPFPKSDIKRVAFDAIDRGEDPVQAVKQSNVYQKIKVSEKQLNRAVKDATRAYREQVQALQSGRIPTGGKKMRGYTKTIKESEQTSEGLAIKLNATYTPKSNKITVQRGREKITYDLPTARNMVLNEPGVSAEKTVIANELVKLHDLKGEHDLAKQVADAYAVKLTEAGQGIQAASLYNKLSPEGVMAYARQTTDGNVPQAELNQLAEMAREIKKLPTGSEEQALLIHEMMERIARRKPQSILDKVMSIWKAGLLTAPTTTGGNIIGNTARFAGEAVAAGPATGIDVIMSLFTGRRTRALTPRGLLKGLKEGGTKGVKYFKTGYDPRRDPLAKFDVQAVYFGDSKAGKAAETYTNGVFRLMGAQDQPFYYSALRNRIAEFAKVEAINRKLKGEAAQKFIREFESGPPTWALEQADKEARYMVYQNDTVIGQIAGALGKAGGADEIPIARAVGNFIVPFRRVPSAVATAITEWGPLGIGRAGLTIAKGMKKGKVVDQRALSNEIAKAGIGTIGIMGLGAYLYDQGLITLDYPTNETERRLWESENKQAFSVKIGGKWRSMNYIQPFGALLASGGEMKRARNEGDDPGQAFMRGMFMQGKSLTEQSFLRGVSGAIGALDDPERRAEQFTEQTAGSIVPNILGKTVSSFDPQEREIEGPLQSFMTDIPGLRRTLYPRRDMFGAPIQNTVGPREIIDPVRSQQERGQDDLIIPELRRLQDAGFGVSPPKIKENESFPGVSEKVQLSQEQVDDLEQMVGPAIREQWGEYMSSAEYAALSDEEKEDALRDISTDVRRAVKVLFMDKHGIGDPNDAVIALDSGQVSYYTTYKNSLPEPNSDPMEAGKMRIRGADATRETNQMQAKTTLQKLKDQNDAYNEAKDIWNKPIDEDSKREIIKDMGLEPDDVAMYDLASQKVDVRTVVLKEELDQLQDRQEIIQTLVEYRKEVNGKMVLTSGVISDLVDDGYISSAEGSMLKNLEYTKDKDGKYQVKMSGRGSGAKAKKIKFVPLNIDTSPAKKIKLSQPSEPPKINFKQPNLGAAVNVPIPNAPKFKVKFNL